MKVYDKEILVISDVCKTLQITLKKMYNLITLSNSTEIEFKTPAF